MILKDLNEIAKKGAQEPLSFWFEDYQKICQKILPQLKKIEPTINTKTIAKENLQNLIKLLEQKKPNAFKLSKLFSYLATIFSNNLVAKDKALINQYIQNCLAFQKICQQEEFFQRKRASIKDTLSLEKQHEYDKRLFENEGMIYCLEFYLQLYKAIQDADTKEQKWHYINSREIDFGTGKLPGLKEDFKNDETLQKFIYLIINDELRGTLIKEYFIAKKIFFSSKSQEKILLAFKKFISVLMLEFQKIGIAKLASFFFTPYGRQPLIRDLKL